MRIYENPPEKSDVVLADLLVEVEILLALNGFRRRRIENVDTVAPLD